MDKRSVVVLLLLSASLWGQRISGGSMSGGQVSNSQPATLVDVNVSLDTQFISTGGTVKAQAFAIYSDGNQQNVTNAIGIVWASSDTGKATIGGVADPRIITAVANGSSNITATYQGIVGASLLTVETPRVTTASLPDGTQSTAYPSQTLQATGGTPPYTWAIVTGALPTGITLSGAGVISGTPSVSGLFNITVKATDANVIASSPSGLTLNIASSVAPSIQAVEPTNWVDSHECDTALTAPDVTRTIKVSGGTYACTYAGFNQSMTDWVAAANQWWKIVVDHGCAVNGGTFTWKAKTGATKCIAYVSDTPLTAGRTVCSHGIQDPHEIAPTTTDPGYRNFGCDGSNLQYGTGSQTYTNVGANAAYNDKASMYTLYYSFAGSSLPAISCAGWDANNIGCHHIAMFDVEVAPDPLGSAKRVAFNNLAVEVVVGGPTLQSQFPQHVHFNRFYFHGDIPDAPVTTAGTYSGVGNYADVACSFCSFMNGYTDQIGNNDGAETHILAIGNSPGPLKIVHNWLEGASINIMSGGNQPTVLGSVPTGIEERRNRLTKPATWMLSSYCGTSSFLSLKSDQEFKVVKQALLDGNIHEYSCATAQDGQNLTLTVRDACNGGSSTCDTNYSAVISDVLVSNAVLRHAANGIQTDARSGGLGNGAGVSLPARRWTLNNVLIYDIGDATRFGTHTPNYMLAMGTSANTWTACTATCNAGGTQATVDCTASPQNTTGSRQHSITTGDIVAVSLASDATFNTSAAPAEGVHASSAVPTSLVVTYPRACTANGAATGITLSNGQGFPQGLDWIHVSAFGKNSSMIGFRGDMWPQNVTFRDSIMAVNTGTGWRTSVSPGGIQAEGTNSENFFDTATLVAHHFVFPERTASAYTEFPTAGGATVHPPTTMYFPSTIGCATNNATTEGTCVGPIGMMSGAGFQLNLSDYHNYALDSTSPFKSGGTKPASDSTDMGMNITNIDNAQTRTQYVCVGSCGTGPNPD